MAEYPRTVLEFRDWFADDAACRDYLARLRWPEGFRCPICRRADHWITARGLRHCRGCGRQTSVTAGTLFADTHLPLRLWFEALWHVSTDGRLAGVWRTGPAGVSASDRPLQR